ncbi:uncharacterized protein [Branchiostoma lanceolatum]|uniref:uncharacterized protein isoform X9 n=1 Tax=Branchiostoma lanceolatum TaxID=7740 RepID=UPI00345294B9
MAGGLTLLSLLLLLGCSASQVRSQDASKCAGSTTNLALKQPTTQSSTGFKGVPGRAVDGDRNPIYGRKSCSHTTMERDPWWRVDLGTSQCVDRVVVAKRLPPRFGKWLEGFKVYVGDNPDVTANPTCGGKQSVAGKKIITVDCGGLTGRYVGIALPGKKQFLILCEVEVYGGAPPAKISKAPPKLGQCAGGTTNLALKQPTTQSSTDFKGVPGRAVDGDRNPRYAKKSCSHTAMERDPWWRVDLGTSQCVDRVVVAKRQFIGQLWLEGFQVYVGDNPDVTANPTCGGKQSVKGKNIITVSCGGLTGRYVGIALPGKKQFLILCEVEVYGGAPPAKISKAPPKLGQCAGSTTNLALKQPTTQSSTGFKGVPDRAVDGDRNPIYGRKSCSHSTMERNPWWRVDLGTSQCVDRVVVAKRLPPRFGKWLEGFKVYVGDNPNVMENPSCGGKQSVAGKDLTTVNCGGLTGRYVGIALPGKKQFLILCEVEVYGGAPPAKISKAPPKLGQCAGGTTNLALKQPTTQSSTDFKGVPGRAVDGDRNPRYAKKSCSHTAMERDPWWRVDLGTSQCVDRVVVAKRQFIGQLWLEGFQVYVGDNPDVTANPTCGGKQSVKGKNIITVSCGGLTGRYVGIALPGKKQFLILCEVEVYGGAPPAKISKAPPKLGQCAGSTTNLALKQPTTQSSTGFKGAPGRAVDGDRNPIYGRKSCSHTTMERNPWWRVDLGTSQCVDRVVVAKRLPPRFGKWLEGFKVYVGDNPDVTANPTCGGKQSVAGKNIITVDCGGLTGRYVGIALPGKKQFLILCEVEVYGGAPPAKISKAPPKFGQCAGGTTNLALKQPTTQSSTDFKGAPGRAVDGDRNPRYAKKSCSHTAMERDPWWRVDLGTSQCVDRVVVAKRQFIGQLWLEGFQVYVGDNPDVTANPTCGGKQSVKGKNIITVSCGGLTGRYVGIALPGKKQFLILCEVEVYGGAEVKTEKVEETGSSLKLAAPKPIDPCKNAKCQNGAECKPLEDSFKCVCPKGFAGDLCETNIDDCAAQPCKNGATCKDGLNGFTCVCPAGYAGDLCETNIDDCAAQPCKNGATCQDGLDGFTCVCPAGYAGDLCETNVDDCAAQPCKNGATCQDGLDGFTCVCPAGYAGDLCETNVDDCAAQPCKNGATCQDGLDGFTCVCPKGYAGNLCETNVDDCAAQPCKNGATCQDGLNGFTCVCPAGYAGDLCETNVDDCAAQPCKNGATCQDGLNGFTCVCPAGYAGDLCETNVDDCAAQPCKNGATCQDGLDGFTCVCPAGYAGDLCETNVDDCAAQPCKNGATCKDGLNGFTCICPNGYAGDLCETNIDECAAQPCQNGATCVDGIYSFTCICPKGYAGDLCETNINECAAKPCQNGGECVDGIFSFKCICPKGYTGDLCEINIDECAAQPCQNGATCVDGIFSFTCICPAGYAGDLCETNIDNCKPNPCKNGGTCNDLVNAFLCSCPEGYGGDLCEIVPAPPPAAKAPAPKPVVQAAKPPAGVVITIGGGTKGGNAGSGGDGAINVINNQISVYGGKGCGCTTPKCVCPVKKGADSSVDDAADLAGIVLQRIRGSEQPEDSPSNVKELDTVEDVYEPIGNEMSLSEDETAYEPEAREEQDTFEDENEDELELLNNKLRKLQQLLRSA